MKERSTLWIHSQIKACMELTDCQPDFCLDLFEPSGHGRKKREIAEYNFNNKTNNLNKHFAKIAENLEYTVLMPGDYYRKSVPIEHSCNTFLLISATLGSLLLFSAIIMCWLANKLHITLLNANLTNSKNLDDLVRYSESSYTGRATTQ